MDGTIALRTASLEYAEASVAPNDAQSLEAAVRLVLTTTVELQSLLPRALLQIVSSILRTSIGVKLSDAPRSLSAWFQHPRDEVMQGKVERVMERFDITPQAMKWLFGGETSYSVYSRPVMRQHVQACLDFAERLPEVSINPQLISILKDADFLLDQAD